MSACLPPSRAGVSDSEQGRGFSATSCPSGDANYLVVCQAVSEFFAETPRMGDEGTLLAAVIGSSDVAAVGEFFFLISNKP